MALPTMASLWVGSALSEIEQVCIQSFLDHGHTFVLYAYEPINGVPVGAEVRDAHEILPTKEVPVYAKEKSPALHASLFRDALIAKTDYIWTDVDVLAVRPFDFTSDYVLGWESEHRINQAVFRLPKASQTLRELRKFKTTTHGIDPNIKKKTKIIKTWLRTWGRGTHISEWRWGTTGPLAITAFLKASGEANHALPPEAFYPVHFHQHEEFLKPGALSMADLSEETFGVHLWGKMLRSTLDAAYDGKVPDGCFIAEALKRHPTTI